MTSILKNENIPLENLVLRVIYAMSFVFGKYQGRIPTTIEYSDYAHDDTRGCIFDMNGIKTDVIYSTSKPKICPSCVRKLEKERVQVNLIEHVQKELGKIKKARYYQIADFIKKYPVWSLVLSTLAALLLGIISSIIADLIPK